MKKYLKTFLDEFPNQTIFSDIELILDHNEPDEEEKKLVSEYTKKYNNIKHIVVDKVDPIGTSMNRCINQSSGEYLCIWNVDDLRTPNSIELMTKTLDENPDVDFVYGNYIVVRSFESTFGYLVDESDKEHLLTKGMILGPFFMFRKSAIEKVGLFDEQLISGADFDLALRLAFNGKGKHIPEILGYYLNEGLGASTRPNSKQPLERTVIELRYGLNILEPHYVEEALKYDIENIIVNGNKNNYKNFKKV
jgi:GT2 family glycosyltransferase